MHQQGSTCPTCRSSLHLRNGVADPCSACEGKWYEAGYGQVAGIAFHLIVLGFRYHPALMRRLAWSVGALGLCVGALFVYWGWRSSPSPVSPGQGDGSASATSHQSFVSLGDVHLKKEEFDLAIERFTDAIRLSPGEARLYLKRGICHAKKGEFGEAIDDFTRAVELEPRLLAAYLERAAAHEARKDVKSAMSDYATLVGFRHEVDKALALARTAERASSDRAGAWRPLRLPGRVFEGDRGLIATAYNRRGLLLAAQGNLDEAVADFGESLQLSVRSETYLNRASVYLRKGNRALAQADCDRARLIDPAAELPEGVRDPVRDRQSADRNAERVGAGRALLRDPQEALALTRIKKLGGTAEFIALNGSRTGFIRVDLRKSAVADDDLKHISALSSVTELLLGSTNVGDACVPHLTRMPALHILDLRDTRVTARGKQAIRASLPGVKIED